ncbi:hypothetical protein BY454_13728 [Marinobacter persicus]|uniref:Uncharacterized protein n=1 Tax=Marinobacter persicus TaxID=930118 RepID=A0A2S6G2N1_9GAMM|nr:hypothetical protein BY455_13728 [Marinobacter persicus]PPK52076.1 hypothetical protein B0H24_103728 [Marinobacter persicus]PPK56607.1 hypothetical protein BY454_13728 [Marinobacter persicus]
MSDHEPTYSRCAVQLNLYSLIKVTGLIGLAGGLSWALIICVLDMLARISHSHPASLADWAGGRHGRPVAALIA